MSSKSITSEGKNILKNMLITVTTTVIGATAVYLLGFNNKKSGPSKLEQEEITIDAWKTYVNLENIYTKNSVSIMRDAAGFGQFKAVYEESIRESEKFLASINQLAQTEGIDKDLKLMLERRATNEKSGQPLMKKYFLGMDSLIEKGVENDWTTERTNDSAIALSNRFTNETSGAANRSITDIEGMSKILSERYDHDFNIDEFLSIQIFRHGKDPYSLLAEEKKPATAGPPKVTHTGGSASGGYDSGTVTLDRKYFIDSWDADGAKIDFSEDGKLSWVVPSNNTEAKGTWTYRDDVLQMNVTNPANGKAFKWEFNVSGATNDGFIMVLSKEPFNRYNLKRR